MNKEFLERYRTAFLMLLMVIITGAVLVFAYSKDKIEYLDRGLIFFAGMSVFFICRNLIKNIKINNEKLGIQIEATQEKETTQEESKQ